MATPEWQAALRRQFGRDQAFDWQNLGSEPIFSRFAVGNPDSRSRYLVRIRGSQPGDNGCTCLDYATNHLGTCKHIEFVLARLRERRGGKTALSRGHTPVASELFLDHAGPRRVRLTLGQDVPPALQAQARALFDAQAGWALHDEQLQALEGFVQQAHALGHSLHCDDAVWQFVAQRRDAVRRREILDAAYPKGADDPGLTDLLKVSLYRHQAEGALFAARAGRALIGDEMGLGKTI